MKPGVFNQLLKEMLEETERVLSSKALEYASGIDRLHNFKKAAELGDCTPLRAAWLMCNKHIVSISDMVSQKEWGDATYEMSMWKEKLGDARNYLYLMQAIIAEEEMKRCDRGPVAPEE